MEFNFNYPTATAPSYASRAGSPVSSRSSYSSGSSKDSYSNILQLEKSTGKVLFLGDLSFFTNEHDIMSILSTFGRVTDVSLRRGVDGQSLLHAFATMDTAGNAARAAYELNDIMFMGRNIKVHISSNNRNNNSTGNKNQKNLPRLHFSFLSKNQSIFVNEIYLRDFFSYFGIVTDVSIKKASVEGKSQTGYGFVFFQDGNDAVNAQAALQGRTINDITFDCHAIIPKAQNFPSQKSTSYQRISAFSHASSGPSYSSSLSSELDSKLCEPGLFTSLPSFSMSLANNQSQPWSQALFSVSPESQSHLLSQLDCSLQSFDSPWMW